ncbi:SCO1860 family LAETG-anchored protein [Kitasatospora arboriphila]|uniref:LPXTG cell wall anchor domain-containing protein n=1 Tax=Kitasatospora arboriphila TaxID=258052 RepID=A0ABP4DU59_9ACTN
MPSRSSVRAVAASLAASALAVSLPAATAQAATPKGSAGSARAVTAEVDLEVSLLDKAVRVPVDATLNKVQTPAERDASMLTAAVDGVDRGRPVTLVKADVGRSVTHSDDRGTSASVTLADADVHAPGLPGTTLLGLQALSAEVTCPVDGRPTAKVTSPLKLTVLGRPVSVGLNSPSRVAVPAVGTVEVEFSKKTVTTTTAAASALEVSVDLNPLNLNVARVTGKVTVASVSCEKPTAAPVVQTSRPAPKPTKADLPVPAGQPGALASTGSSGTGTLVGGAATLLVTGGAALWATRRRRAHARRR